jgi:hypothetical protein
LKSDIPKNEYKLLKAKCEKTLPKKENIKLFDFNNININVLGIKIKHKEKKFKQPIDLVYCWVDGNDKKWQKEKQYWQQQTGILVDNAIGECRFTDNNELKYSLRSVAKNAPWINHIYIVTNGQIPKWLDTNHPKITIVNHNEIMHQKALPTFNSDAIETCIDNIPNLSEYFIYGNDDFYIYSKVTPEYFFDKKGNPITRLVKHKWKKEQIEKQLYLKNITYNAKLIKEKFGTFYSYEPIHNMDSYRKSYFKECKKEFEKEFNKSVLNKFRTPNSIQRTIHYYYMIVKKYSSL